MVMGYLLYCKLAHVAKTGKRGFFFVFFEETRSISGNNSKSGDFSKKDKILTISISVSFYSKYFILSIFTIGVIY